MISDNSIFKQKMNEIIKKEKESQENIKRIIDNYKQIAGKNSEYLKRINKIFQNEDLDESYLEGNTLIDSYESTSKLKTTNKNVSLLLLLLLLLLILLFNEFSFLFKFLFSSSIRYNSFFNL